MKLYFMNNGEFDLRAMLTMGVSVKNDSSAIGYFGTGFKYAVAIILRLGGTISVRTMGETYLFSARPETIRGKEFDVVYINDESANFTTHMGVNWQPWMAFRELYCNALDEHNGAVSLDEKDTEGFDTVVEVDCREIMEAYQNREIYFIGMNETPIARTPNLDVFEGGRPYVYFRGVAVKELSDNFLYSYNLKGHVTLTEDRTLQYGFHMTTPIRQFWQLHCDDKVMLYKALQNGKHGEVVNIGFDPDVGASDSFLDACDALAKTTVGLSASARAVANKVRRQRGQFDEFELTAVQKKMLVRALERLEKIGVTVSDFPVKFVTGMGEGIMGLAAGGVIYISEMPFNMGTKQLASTLMEEWVHNKYGFRDFDRSMQNWLFDKILSMSEDITGEPF